MDSTTTIAAVCTFLGTAFAAWLTYKATAGKTRSDFIEKLLEECKQLRNSLNGKDKLVLELQIEVRKLQEEVHGLREQLTSYESTRAPSDSPHLIERLVNTIPYPVWIHEVGANKWYLNDRYSKRFGVPRKDFWTPVNIFRFYPSERAAHFVQNDMAVIESNVGKHVIEQFPKRIMEPISNDNELIPWEVVKVPVRAGGRNYVLGFCNNSECNDTVVDFFRKESESEGEGQ